jgi:hypothetical protein
MAMFMNMELIGSTEGWKSLEQLSSHQLLIEDSVPGNRPVRHQSPEEILIHYLNGK